MSDELSRGPNHSGLPANSVAADYYSVLERVIEMAKGDPAQLRRVVYDLARWNLKNDVWTQYPPLNKFEMREHLNALEAAIARIEHHSVQDEELQIQRERMRALEAIMSNIERESSAQAGEPAAQPEAEIIDVDSHPPDRVERQTNAVVLVTDVPAARAELMPMSTEPPRQPTRERTAAVTWMIAWPVVNLAAIAVLGWVVYSAIVSRLDTPRAQVQARQPADETAAAPASAPNAQDRAAASTPAGLPFPTPRSYGVYALSGGTLYGLDPLPMRVPDPRIRISAEIAKPPAAMLPDGKLSFVVYRRDMVNAAPERVTVRVIARVVRSITFEGGKATTTPIEGAWHMRNQSTYLKVEPVSQNREMILLRPDQPDFALSGGRYALVLGDQAYDFSVDAPITDPQQCLERFQSANGPLLSECRNP